MLFYEIKKMYLCIDNYLKLNYYLKLYIIYKIIILNNINNILNNYLKL